MMSINGVCGQEGSKGKDTNPIAEMMQKGPHLALRYLCWAHMGWFPVRGCPFWRLAFEYIVLCVVYIELKINETHLGGPTTLYLIETCRTSVPLCIIWARDSYYYAVEVRGYKPRRQQ